jgi:DnaK suppressor protein
MNKSNIKKFKHKLLLIRAELNRLKQSLKESTATVVLDQNSVGRLSRMDAMQAQQMAMEAERRRKNNLIKINAPLLGIDNDDYGYCEACDEAIILGRLSIDPAAIRCVDCCDMI